jgi:queuosine precursor transporter
MQTSFFNIQERGTRLWAILTCIFVTNAIVAEFMGVKLFSLEKTLGFLPTNWSFLGQSGLSFTLTAGVLLWPVVFIMTDIINEYFGAKCVRFLSYLTAALITYGFIMLFFAIQLEPADFWLKSHIKADWPIEQQNQMTAEVSNYNSAYRIVFGQSLWIIVGSLFAFLVSQLVDVAVFHKIKRWSGEQNIALRSTGSTLVSQFLDSFVVVFIALYIGQQLPFLQVLAIAIMSYIYKACVAVLLTPVLYLVHNLIDRYLGEPLAKEMKANAALV